MLEVLARSAESRVAEGTMRGILDSLTDSLYPSSRIAPSHENIPLSSATTWFFSSAAPDLQRGRAPSRRVGAGCAPEPPFGMPVTTGRLLAAGGA